MGISTNNLYPDALQLQLPDFPSQKKAIHTDSLLTR